MARVEKMKWDDKGTQAFRFFCPGCESSHAPIEGRWTFNGDYDRPTFTPSLNVTGSKMTEKGEADYEAWRIAGYPKRDEPFDSIPTVCHSYITNGRIRYLEDCTHSLAGQTIDIPTIDDHEEDTNG